MTVVHATRGSIVRFQAGVIIIGERRLLYYTFLVKISRVVFEPTGA